MKTINTNQPFDIQILELTEWQQRPVKNNFFEVVYIENGKGTQCINYNHYPYQGENIFLLPPLRCHSFTIEKPTKFVFLRFTKSFFNHNKNNASDFENWFKEASYILANYKQQPGEVIKNENDRRNVISLMNTIVYETQNNGLQSVELIKSLMVSMLHILMRSIKKSTAEIIGNDIQDERLAEMTSYIQEHIDTPDLLKIENLATVFFMSPTYISEFFKKTTGTSLREYIAKSRLKLVEIRLLYSDYTLNQIADELGFTDASHLSRTFKKYSGQTIREFKKKGDYCLLKSV